MKIGLTSKAILLVLPFLIYGCKSHTDGHSYKDCVDIDFSADTGPKECMYIVFHTSENRVPTKINKSNGKSYFTKVARERGFPSQSYHFIIYEDGQTDTLTKLNLNSKIDYWEKTCGVAGYNSISVHIVYVGGLNRWGMCKDTRTESQKYSGLLLQARLLDIFPKAKVVGHNNLNPDKGCPCFKMLEWLQSIKL